MGNIIPFNRGKHMAKQESSTTDSDPFEKANAEFGAEAKRFEESDGDEGMEEFLKAMGELARGIFEDPDVREMMEREEEREKEFDIRNQEITKNEPRFDAGLRMQYYAGIMLGLADKVFHTEDGFSRPFDDFAYFMQSYGTAFSQYSKQYTELEEEYFFTGGLTFDVAELERMVVECLEEVIQLKPHDSDRDKTRLLYLGSRMFELYRNMLYYSSEKGGGQEI